MKNNRLKWASRLDSFCIIIGAMVPTGIIIGNAGFESMIALVGICWITRSILAKENPLPPLLKHSLILPWLCWIGSIVLSLAWNGAGSKGWVHDIVLIRYLIYFAALLDISQRRSIIVPLLSGLAAGILWGVLNTLMAFSIGYDILGNSIMRYSTKLKETSRIASLAAYVGPFFLAWSFLDSRLSYKIKIAIAFVGSLAMIYIAHANILTVQIAGVAGILSFVTYFLIKTNPRIGVFFIFLLAGLSIIVVMKYGGQINLHSMYDRINIWKVAWGMWLNHPFVGGSVSSWPDFYKEVVASGSITPYVPPNGKISWSLDARHAHNLFLQLISCTGVLGLMSFCWLFINAIRITFQKKVSGWRFGLMTWPIVFLVIGLAGWNIFGSQYQAVFAYFMVLTAVSVNQQEIAD